MLMGLNGSRTVSYYLPQTLLFSYKNTALLKLYGLSLKSKYSIETNISKCFKPWGSEVLLIESRVLNLHRSQKTAFKKILVYIMSWRFSHWQQKFSWEQKHCGLEIIYEWRYSPYSPGSQALNPVFSLRDEWTGPCQVNMNFLPNEGE